MDKRPNFLVIVADDLGFSDVGAFGGEIHTPNIDRLASSGIRFTDFHSAAACSPTRSMLLTGTDNRIGTMMERLDSNAKPRPGYEGYLNDRVVTLPELLRDAGYNTYMSGKWHLGLTPDRWPCARGFERSYSLLTGAANHYGWEPQLLDNDDTPAILRKTNVFYVEDNIHIQPKDLGEGFYSSKAFADKLIEFLDDRSRENKTDKKPFFSYLAFSAPHWPLQAPESDIKRYSGVYNEGPEALRQSRLCSMKNLGLIPDNIVPHEVNAFGKGILSKAWNELDEAQKRFSSRTMECYAGMVDNMDQQIGRVLDQLERENELENTVIMFMSDNGAEGLLLEALPLIHGNVHDHIAKYYDNSIENLGRKNSYIWYGPHWASAATAPSRLYKAFPTEGGIRVPMIFSYPPMTANRPGRIDHSFGTVMDIAPTILQMAGASHPGTNYKGREVAAMRGISWVSFLQGDEELIHGDDAVMGWELFGRMAIRKGDYKAIFIPQPFGKDVWELFNIRDDPGEVFDLASSQPERLSDMLSEWETYKNEVGVM